MSQPTRRALRLSRHVQTPEELLEALRIVEEPVPTPRRGQVLVEVEAAPCNPSDLIFLAGRYPADRALPAMPGFEGCGRVVAHGGDGFGRWLKGRRVAFGTTESGDGSWGERAVVPAMQCIPLPDSVPPEQGATLIVNPLSARAMVFDAARAGARGILVTAAASQLARQALTLAKLRGLRFVGTVRRAEQVDELLSLGADAVVHTGSEDVDGQLAQACERFHVTRALDAIGGEWPARLLRAMGPGTTCVVYGALAEVDDFSLPMIDVLASECRVQGFYLGRWFARAGWIERLNAIRFVRRMFASRQFETGIAEQVGLEDWPEALVRYHRGMSRGKVVLRLGR